MGHLVHLALHLALAVGHLVYLLHISRIPGTPTISRTPGTLGFIPGTASLAVGHLVYLLHTSRIPGTPTFSRTPGIPAVSWKHGSIAVRLTP